MAAITVTPVTRFTNGTALGAGQTVNQAGTDSVANNEKTFLVFTNTATTATSVAIATVTNVDGLGTQSDTVTTTQAVASTPVFVGPFPAAIYGSSLTLTSSGAGVATLKVQAFTL